MLDRIHELQNEIVKLKEELAGEIARREDEVVEDWELTMLDGTKIKLSDLFAGKNELLVVHNMGRGCHYCSLWGDAMIGVAPHIMQRCSFVLCSNDPEDSLAEFKELRGWDFPCVSGYQSGFAKAMGYMDDEGRPLPGVSGFHKRCDGTIVRTGHASFGPGDDFCAVWPMFDLIKNGKADWEPAHGKVEACAGSGGASCCCS